MVCWLVDALALVNELHVFGVRQPRSGRTCHLEQKLVHLCSYYKFKTLLRSLLETHNGIVSAELQSKNSCISAVKGDYIATL